MNTNLRALIFGTAVAAALTITLDTVTAAEPQVVRLETVHVVGHRATLAPQSTAEIVRLDTVVVTGHRAATIG